MRDPRHRNEPCDRSGIGAYLLDYADRLRTALVAVDADALDRARDLIETTAMSGGRVYSIGNGGSAAVADHLCCDFTKGTHASGHPVIHSQSMTANMALYSAVANDFGFEQVFAHQIDLVGRPGDLLVAISSSGNSANIVNAVEAARGRGMPSIGLSGFEGGRLRTSVDVALHVPINNYGIVEDAHQALMHVLAQYIALGRDGAPA
jgi:D-sedoheptulose 7-phosphate isomerase